MVSWAGCRQLQRSILLCLISTTIVLIVIYASYTTHFVQHTEEIPYTETEWNLANTVPKILFWSTYFGKSPNQQYGVTEALKNCPVRCVGTEDKRELLSSDVVAFHMVDINGGWSGSSPERRHPNQIWVLYGQESPINFHVDLKPSVDSFNWTMTYRLDSDIVFPYGKVVRHDHELPALASVEAQNLTQRPNLVCWANSHCYTFSDRESLGRQLRNFLQDRLYIYGRCGQHSCPPQDAQSHNCYPLFAHKCKFYLAFENSLCVDYVTEKFYDPMLYDMVPIVYGWANYSNQLVAPPGSYINTADYNNMAELAEYLLYLDQHDEEYLKYFAWKRKWSVVRPNVWCDLCMKAKIKIEERFSERKWHHNIDDWWHKAPAFTDKSDPPASTPVCKALRNSDRAENWLDKIHDLFLQPKI